MHKSRFALAALAIAAAFAMPAMLVGCDTTPTATASTPEAQAAQAKQQVIDSLYRSYKTLDVAIDGTMAMLVAGKLKTADARKAVDGYKAAKVGLDASLASLGAPPPPAK